jgi:hypothetical protein
VLFCILLYFRCTAATRSNRDRINVILAFKQVITRDELKTMGEIATCEGRTETFNLVNKAHTNLIRLWAET